MSSRPALIKQIACGRRRPDMTRKEYFDHRYRVHGRIADAPEEPDFKPHKYVQTQIFDSAFGPRSDGPLNANHPWFGRDDMTELYFRDWGHVKACFGSEYAKTKVGPDATLFADFESAISLMAYEKNVSLKTKSLRPSGELSENRTSTVAAFFIATPNNEREGQDLESLLSPSLVAAIEENAQNEVWNVIANVGTVSEHYNLNSYFGGGGMPHYALVYKIYLRDRTSITAMRKAQKAFEKSMDKSIDKNNSFIVFGEEVLVLDQARNIKFDLKRQPQFNDLLGPSHLD